MSLFADSHIVVWWLSKVQSRFLSWKSLPLSPWVVQYSFMQFHQHKRNTLCHQCFVSPVNSFISFGMYFSIEWNRNFIHNATASSTDCAPKRQLKAKEIAQLVVCQTVYPHAKTMARSLDCRLKSSRGFCHPSKYNRNCRRNCNRLWTVN